MHCKAFTSAKIVKTTRGRIPILQCMWLSSLSLHGFERRWSAEGYQNTHYRGGPADKRKTELKKQECRIHYNLKEGWYSICGGDRYKCRRKVCQAQRHCSTIRLSGDRLTGGQQFQSSGHSVSDLVFTPVEQIFSKTSLWGRLEKKKFINHCDLLRGGLNKNLWSVKISRNIKIFELNCSHSLTVLMMM